MFGQSDNADNGMGAQMPAMDQPAPEHDMTPAYQDASATTSPVPSVADDNSMAVPQPMGAVSGATSSSDDDLLSIKQDAMNALSPLVGHLDQTPEEKFRTTMMMIQASDDRSFIRQAYEAAQAITDEKVRAQALLDVINEINYFTSHTS